MKHKKVNKRTPIRGKRKHNDHLYSNIDAIIDIGIKACDAKDALKAQSVINKLKGLLDQRYKEISFGLFRLYDFCLQLVNDKKFDNAREILFDLHQSWNVIVLPNINYARVKN